MTTGSRRLLEAVLLTAGIAGIGVWGWSTAREGLYQDYQGWVFDREQAGQTASLGQYLREKVTGSSNLPPQPAAETQTTQQSVPAPEPPHLTDPDLLGRLRIPRLNLQAMVREGASEKTLSIALGHVKGTAKPGENGNVGVAGHRDSLFRGLRDIRLNDRIVFDTSSGDTYVYQVSSTKIVKPTEVSVLNAGLFPELTLVTCYPFNYIGSAPDRFIVKARQIGQTTGARNAVELAEARPSTSPPAVQQPLAQAPVEQKRAPLPRVVPATTRAPLPYARPRRIPFEVFVNHSRQLAPGISIGLSADRQSGAVDGWMWVMPERRTIWLRDQNLRQPIFIHGPDGERRQVVIDSVTRNSMRGYLVL